MSQCALMLCFGFELVSWGEVMCGEGDGAEEKWFREKKVAAAAGGREDKSRVGRLGQAGGAIYWVVGVCLGKMNGCGGGSSESQAGEAGEQASDERTRKPDSGGRRGMWGRRCSGVSLHYRLPRNEVLGGTMSNFDLDRPKRRGREKRDVGEGVHVEARDRDFRGHVTLVSTAMYVFSVRRAASRRDEEHAHEVQTGFVFLVLFLRLVAAFPWPSSPWPGAAHAEVIGPSAWRRLAVPRTSCSGLGR